MLVTAIFSMGADLIWGGQFDRFLPKGFRRFTALFVMFMGFFIPLDFWLALTATSAYLLVRVSGWRFKPLDNELFLVMTKKRHIFFAFTYGLSLNIIPLITFFSYGTNLLGGMLYFTALSLLLSLVSYFVMNAVNKFETAVPIKEAIWGFIFGLATYVYFYTTI